MRVHTSNPVKITICSVALCLFSLVLTQNVMFLWYPTVSWHWFLGKNYFSPILEFSVVIKIIRALLKTVLYSLGAVYAIMKIIIWRFVSVLQQTKLALLNSPEKWDFFESLYWLVKVFEIMNWIPRADQLEIWSRVGPTPAESTNKKNAFVVTSRWIKIM